MPERDTDATPSSTTHSTGGGGSPIPVEQLTAGQKRNLRIGLWLFAVYTLFYTGFVLVNAFAPEWSDWEPFGGLNLAVIWGFALIVLAFLLAIVYGFVCRGDGDDSTAGNGDQSEARA